MPQPWSVRLGRAVYLPKLLARHEPTRRTFDEERLIEHLVDNPGTPLKRLGAGLSERVIEIPWSLRALERTERRLRILDVGTAFAPTAYKRQLIRLPHAVEAVDLARARLPGISAHVADVRNLPFADAHFDFALCISTLEHIGLDNAHYGVESGGDGDLRTLRELGRVARRVLVTVPAGHDANMGWQRQYAPATFRSIVEQAGLVCDSLDLFRHDSQDGWVPADEAAVAASSYGCGAVAAAACICAELRQQ